MSRLALLLAAIAGQGGCAGGSPWSQTFSYDIFGNLSKSGTQSFQPTYSYLTNHMTQIGSSTPTYDANGNVICYAYDALHRVTSVYVASGTYATSTPYKYLVYDSATVDSIAMANAKGRLAEAYTSASSCPSPCASKITDEGFSYTARGESSDVYESTPHSSGYYHVNQTYWANGAPNVLSGLTGLPTITYNVDGEGRIYSASASSGQNPLGSTSYNAASQATQVNLGSSDIDAFNYDPHSNRLTKYTFSVNGQSVVG